jgi:hypothetical protein
MNIARFAITTILVTIELFDASSVRAAVKCPSDSLQDQSLVYLSENGPLEIRGEQTNDKIPLNEQIDFVYVLRKDKKAPDEGAILVKRIYDIPDGWRDSGNVVTMRRNKEPEQKNFPGAVYQKYHEDLNLTTIELHRGFHADYTRKDRTDDSEQKRESFLFEGSVLESKRKLAKPLILTWKGFEGKNSICLDFNLNEGEGSFKRIEVFIYEIEKRGQTKSPRQTVHLTIMPKS